MRSEPHDFCILVQSARLASDHQLKLRAGRHAKLQAVPRGEPPGCLKGMECHPEKRRKPSENLREGTGDEGEDERDDERDEKGDDENGRDGKGGNDKGGNEKGENETGGNDDVTVQLHACYLLTFLFRCKHPTL